MKEEAMRNARRNRAQNDEETFSRGAGFRRLGPDDAVRTTAARFRGFLFLFFLFVLTLRLEPSRRQRDPDVRVVPRLPVYPLLVLVALPSRPHYGSHVASF